MEEAVAERAGAAASAQAGPEAVEEGTKLVAAAVDGGAGLVVEALWRNVSAGQVEADIVHIPEVADARTAAGVAEDAPAVGERTAEAAGGGMLGAGAVEGTADTESTTHTHIERTQDIDNRCESQ